MDDTLQPSQSETPKEVVPSVSASVKQWQERIRAARNTFEPDFKRMRSDMEFAAGYQWQGQETMEEDRYIANLVVRLVNQKVANLYARNPKFVAQRRRRLDFVMWDGRMESLQQAAALSSSPEADPAHQMQGLALIADYTRGRQQRDLIDKVGESLEHVFSWNLDNQMPSFKVQMKQLVRRVVTAGVGYCRLNFARTGESSISTTDAESTAMDRIKAAQVILGKVASGEISEDSPEMETLSNLLQFIQPTQLESGDVQERLVFDFPPATSVIVDPRCRSLKGFIGAKWIAQEYILPLDEVNAHFGTNIKVGGELKLYSEGDKETLEHNVDTNTKDENTKGPRVCLWEIFDSVTKTSLFICDGWKDFVRAPGPMSAETKHFWPLFALTFNDIEVEPGQQKASIYPPSDVQLLRAAQKEWNRSRNELRAHRKANVPRYATARGALSTADLEAITDAVPNSVIQLDSLIAGQDIGKLLVPMGAVPLDPLLYSTDHLNQDLFTSIGNEQNTQPASSRNTATAASINEQSRLITTSSNVDDLDDFLSDIAEAGGNILMLELSEETVKRVAGDGAVWPDIRREDFINYVYLSVMASSSGRPNKALEIANFQQLAPTLIAAGANPEFIVREAIKRLDDRLDIDEAFPFGPSQGMMAMPTQPQQQEGAPSTTPARGSATPTRAGQNPQATIPRPNIQKPQIAA